MICVVGEFKKGKSALINALLGSDVCPVDDDLATTTVTVVRYSTEPTAAVRRRVDGQLVSSRSRPTTSVPGSPERDGVDLPRGVEVVEVGLPNAFLERGVSLVDTPGRGWPERRARRGDPRLPAVGRRAGVRDRRVRRAVRAGAGVPGERAVGRTADPRRPDQGRHLPRLASDRGDRRGPPPLDRPRGGAVCVELCPARRRPASWTTRPSRRRAASDASPTHSSTMR